MSMRPILKWIAGGAFLALFPGFIFYHYVVSVGLVPPVIGGLFGPVALLTLAAYLLLLPFFVRDLFGTRPLYVFGVLGFLLYVLAYALTYYALYATENMRLAAEQSVVTVVFWSSLFLMGYFLPIESKGLIRINQLCALLISLFIVHYVSSTGSLFFYAAEIYQADEGVATYQGFARSALVLWIFLTVVARSEIYRAILVLTGLFVMFVLGARSELYAFAGVAGALFLLYSLRKPRVLLLGAVVFSLLTLVIVANLQALSESRQLQVLDLQSSSSWIARQDLAAQAWQQIVESPLFGSFGSHVQRGGTGYYAHNLFSAWENFGLVGVGSYLLLTVVAGTVSAYHCFVRGGWLHDRWKLSFAMNLVCLLLIFVAKPVFWPLVALGWGLYVNAAQRSARAAQPVHHPRPAVAFVEQPQP